MGDFSWTAICKITVQIDSMNEDNNREVLLPFTVQNKSNSIISFPTEASISFSSVLLRPNPAERYELKMLCNEYRRQEIILKYLWHTSTKKTKNETSIQY